MNISGSVGMVGLMPSLDRYEVWGISQGFDCEYPLEMHVRPFSKFKLNARLALRKLEEEGEGVRASEHLGGDLEEGEQTAAHCGDRLENLVLPLAARPSSFTPDGRSVCIFQDLAAVYAAVCTEVQEAADAAISSKGCFSLMLPAGGVIEALADLQLASPDKVFVFFTHGSTAVPNYQQAMEHFGTRLGVPAANVHDVSTASAREYETLLNSHRAVGQGASGPVLDMIALGVGADGHCGALYPNSPATLAAGKGEVVLALSDADKPGPGVAVSMDVMRCARRVLVACAGAVKADAVKAALAGPEDAACPVSLLRTKATAWFVDTAAAEKYQADAT